MNPFKEFEHRGWQAVAGRYHDAFASITLQSVQPLLQAVAAGSGVHLLDLACGPGYVAGAAAVLGCRVLGVDFSSEMVAEARRRYPDLRFEEDDAECLSLAENSFDAVVMNYGMLHLSQPEKAVRESWRVLRPGGRFAFTVWDVPERTRGMGIVLEAVRQFGDLNVALPPGPPFFRFSDPSESARVLSAAGFDGVEICGLTQHWQLSSADDLFEIFHRGSVRNGALLKAQKSNDLSAIRTAIRESVMALQKGSGFELPMPAVLATAHKA
jgi:SAM-dependent methyltransferase